MVLPLVLGAPTSVREQQKRNSWAWWWAYAPFLLVVLTIAAIVRLGMPTPFSLAVGVLGLAALATLWQARFGLYLCVGLALLGDARTAPWYPFVKNASSRESILFAHDALVVSPLDVLLALTLLTWVLSRLQPGRPPIAWGTLVRPVAAFGAFVVFGLVHGLATGGDRAVALWLARPLLYLPVAYVLACNLLPRQSHRVALFWVVAVALSLEGINGVMVAGDREPMASDLVGASLVEHSAALHMNTMFVLAVAVWLVPGCSKRMRIALPVLAAPTLVTYALSERRAAFIGLMAAACILSAVVFRSNRRAFWLAAPCILVTFAGYLGATWNAAGPAGLPAQAVKSVVAPDQLSEVDSSSNAYRVVETFNVVETVRSAPLTGIGFGQPFLRPLPLPDLSFFVWFEFVPHNSLLWIWTQVGLAGFVTTLYLLGAAISTGARTVVQSCRGDHTAVLLTSVCFLVMFLIYAYVDIVWDAQTTLYLGAALAVIATGVPRLEPDLDPAVERALGPVVVER